jgi:phage terminase large subunit GpA-like protein
MPDFSYIDRGKRAAALYRASLNIVPRPRQKPDEWGALNRVYPAHTGVPGPRDPNLTPYAIEWARVLGANVSGGPLYIRGVLACGAQMGKTDSMLDVIGERMDNRPSPIIYVGPNKEFNVDQFEPRLMQLFDESENLGAKLARGKRMKKTRKLVSGVPVRLAHAGSSTALKSDPAALALVDEYDEMMGNIRGQGDPLGLVEARGFTYADFVTGISSTPSLGAVECDEPDPASGLIFWKPSHPDDVKSPIWRLFQGGTMHHWCWRCPHCDQWFVPRMNLLSWTHAKRQGREQASPTEARRTAYLECPRCHKHIEDKWRTVLNETGRMVAPGQSIDEDGNVCGDPPDSQTASFWVSGLCSPFRTFGERAQDLVTAENSGDSHEIQTIVNSRFGECYINLAGDAPEWAHVKAHANIYERGTVPSDVVKLVMTVDVQKNRIMWLVRGWGARGTSWLVDYGELWGETFEAGVWDDLADLIKQPWDGMDLNLVLVDSGFRPGKKDEMPINRVYDFCRRFSSLVKPTKGSSTPMRTPISKAKAEVTRKASAARYGLEVVRLDTDRWKSFVHEKVKWPDDSPGAWHLFADVSDDYCRQIVSESRVIHESGRVEWVRRNKENHFLDCEAMQGAASYMLNMQRMKERPHVQREEDHSPPPEQGARVLVQGPDYSETKQELTTHAQQISATRKRTSLADRLPK